MPNPLIIKTKAPPIRVLSTEKPVHTPSMSSRTAAQIIIKTIACSIFYTPIGHKP